MQKEALLARIAVLKKCRTSIWNLLVLFMCGALLGSYIWNFFIYQESEQK
jgi:hypothetical protein